jgi:hypothetical protein
VPSGSSEAVSSDGFLSGGGVWLKNLEKGIDGWVDFVEKSGVFISTLHDAFS